MPPWDLAAAPAGAGPGLLCLCRAAPSTADSSQLVPPSQDVTHGGASKSHLQHPPPESRSLRSFDTEDFHPRCPFCSPPEPTEGSSTKLHPVTSTLRGKGGQEQAGGAKSLAEAHCLGWGCFKAVVTFGQPTQPAKPPWAVQTGQPLPSCHLKQPCAAARPAWECPASPAAAPGTSCLQHPSGHHRQFSRLPQDTERVVEPLDLRH